MKFKPTKILTFILLMAIMVTSLGSVLNFVWCDSGSLSDNHTANHIDNHEHDHIGDHAGEHADINVVHHSVFFDQHISSGTDSCLDASIEHSNGLLRTIRWHSAVAINPDNARLAYVKVSSLVATVASFESPLQIPQSILFLRTIVLLT